MALQNETLYSTWLGIFCKYNLNLPFTEATKAKDAFYNAEREIKEIEGIIPEIKEKIADTKDMQQETIKKIGDRRLVENMIAQVAATKEGAENGKIF